MVSFEMMLNALAVKLELRVDVELLVAGLRGFDYPPRITMGEAADFILHRWNTEPL